MKEGTTFVFYDVVDDRIRNRVVKVCKDYGLERIQFSGFQGELNRNRRSELHLRLIDTLGDHSGKILILPVCERDLHDRKEILVEGDGCPAVEGRKDSARDDRRNSRGAGPTNARSSERSVSRSNIKGGGHDAHRK